MQTLTKLAAALVTGKVTSRALVEQCLERIGDPGGEGQRTFIKTYGEAARDSADFADKIRARHAAPSPYTGIPISIKDLFDVAGDVTTAGSIALRDGGPARSDAPAIARLKNVGFVLIGRTNMTEFAFSGIGANPHYGTPLNPYDRPGKRIPGGSSSGAAISITDGMAFGAIGTDTGGSSRIPAALTGIVGYKPTARRIPRDGAIPLSTTLDSIGPLANSVACCDILDRFMAGEAPAGGELPIMPVARLRLANLRTLVLDGLDDDVARAFDRALATLSRAGAVISDLSIPAIGDIAAINSKGGFSAAEGYAWHQHLIETRGELYDPRVLSRFLRGREQAAADYLGLFPARQKVIASANQATIGFDALIMPAVARIAPRLSELAADDDYLRINMHILRNCAVVNFLDRCAISIPCHNQGEAPVGLMLMGEHGADRHLFSLAAGVEAALRTAAAH